VVAGGDVVGSDEDREWQRREKQRLLDDHVRLWDRLHTTSEGLPDANRIQSESVACFRGNARRESRSASGCPTIAAGTTV
jgi:hypothetical protein